MDQKKIGNFLKELRKARGLTQEQVAEVFGVAGRTVSRWETGSNMPDLSILIQIADYYNVEIREILDGEKDGGDMDKEMKETLEKVADYSQMQKEKAARIGCRSFEIMFYICAAVIVIQMILNINESPLNMELVLGETIVFVCGGFAYIVMIVKNGLWNIGLNKKRTIMDDAKISILCGTLFSIIFDVVILKTGVDFKIISKYSLVFWLSISLLSFLVLRGLNVISNKNKC